MNTLRPSRRDHRQIASPAMSDQRSAPCESTQIGPSTKRWPVEIRSNVASSGMIARATSLWRSTGAATSLATATLVAEEVAEDVRRARRDHLDDRGAAAVDGAQRPLQRGLDGFRVLDAIGLRAERLRDVAEPAVPAPAHRAH